MRKCAGVKIWTPSVGGESSGTRVRLLRVASTSESTVVNSSNVKC